jgi:hypothetical protein
MSCLGLDERVFDRLALGDQLLQFRNTTAKRLDLIDERFAVREEFSILHSLSFTAGRDGTARRSTQKSLDRFMVGLTADRRIR